MDVTSRWWFQILFIFTPKFEGDEPILTSIFFNGFGSTTSKLSLTPGFLFKDEIVLLKLVPSFRGHVVSLLGAYFWKMHAPRSLTARPSKVPFAIGKACLPTTIFQGLCFKLPGGYLLSNMAACYGNVYNVKKHVQWRGVSWGGALQT